jgi:hypothetical protein
VDQPFAPLRTDENGRQRPSNGRSVGVPESKKAILYENLLAPLQATRSGLFPVIAATPTPALLKILK